MKTVITIVCILLLCLAFFGGYKYHESTVPEPINTTDTIVEYDTITYTITQDYYFQTVDTIIDTVQIPQDVDTLAILADYFTTYKYTRNWIDTNLSVTLVDNITQNKVESELFTYKILRPQKTIINTTNITNYSRYLYGGVSVPLDNSFNNLGVNLLYADNRWYGGIQYEPFNPTYHFELKFGIRIFKFR